MYLIFWGDLDSREKLLPISKSTRISSLETGLFHPKEGPLSELSHLTSMWEGGREGARERGREGGREGRREGRRERKKTQKRKIKSKRKRKKQFDPKVL